MHSSIIRRIALHMTLFGAATLALPLHAQADVLKNETEVRQLADKAMAAAGKGNVDDAYAAIAPYTLKDINAIEQMRTRQRTARMQLEQSTGQAIGYEFIRSERVGESLLKLVYVEKAEKQALPWQFIFYKTPAGWALSQVSMGGDLNVLFSR